jgi:hypothetical protein
VYSLQHYDSLCIKQLVVVSLQSQKRSIHMQSA